MGHFFTDELNKKIRELSQYLTWDEDNDHYPREDQARTKLEEFAFNIRSLAHQEIAQEMYQIKQRWDGLDDKSAAIAADVLIGAVEKSGENMDVFRETLQRLAGTCEKSGAV